MVKKLFSIKKISIGFLLFSLFSPILIGEIKDDLIFILNNSPIKMGAEKRNLSFISNETSEFKTAAILLIHLYQEFISSQDKPVCNFTISCSHFGVSAIKKYGVIHGIFMASDRLQRCNGLGRKYYPIDSKTGLAIDYSIDNYYLGEKGK